MGELVSVIVPIYKVEHFLPRCIDSILNQKHKDFELILVDDGSPDQCSVICDQYAQRDDRIRVIHKKNGGLSDARNAGLKIATGKFIAFVDSDDWVASDYLSSMLEVLQETESDICECGVLRTTGNTNAQSDTRDITEVYDTEAALKQLICDGVFHQYVWNKLYKRNCIEGISFPVGKTNEDEFWTYRVFGHAHKIAKLNKVLYYYFQREGSIMSVGYNLKRLDALEAKQQRQTYVELYYPTLSAVAKVNLFTSCIYSGQMALKFLKGQQRKKAIHIIESVQSNNCPTQQEIKNLTGSKKMWIQMARVNFWMLCRLKNLLGKGF